MDIQMKQYADNGNLKELKYIFVDALDVDPTFVGYEEDYNYCLSIPGLLEPHIELTPFTQDTTLWDESYWVKLKMDLIKNFSHKRMSHMREVAKVFLAEKVERILQERAMAAKVQNTPVVVPAVRPVKASPATADQNTAATQISKSEQARRDLEKARRELEEDNRRAEAAERADAERIRRRQMMNQNSYHPAAGDGSKKAIGIAMAVLLVAAIVLVLLLK